jgi:uncharacterized glyoxalase superfamily protein PhnB
LVFPQGFFSRLVLKNISRILKQSFNHAKFLYQEFNRLSEGGKNEMPIADGPLGSYFGMFADKFGVQWMVDFTPKFSGQK